MGEPLIQTINLKKYFNTPKGLLHAVDGVNISVDKGQTLGVVGESGCGKSTLGRVILRLIDATDGQVLYKGQDILKFSNREVKSLRKEMQIIFQDPYASINPRMSVSEIIGEPLVIHKVYKSKHDLQKRVEELMDTVGLAQRLVNTYPHELDGGRRQRIGVARALAMNPEFIVCDEPVSALDVSIQAQILNLMMDLQEELGLTYIFITHDLSVVKHISNDITVMYLGQCVEQANSDAIFEEPMHPYTKSLLKAIPVPDISYKGKKREILHGEVTSPINPAPGCRFYNRCPYASEQCKAPVVQREIKPGHFVSCHLYDNGATESVL